MLEREGGCRRKHVWESISRMRLGNDSGGFTLIEMSIVLVVIGLIVGGILVGRDMIIAAGVRAQVTEIEKYNTAVNTFRDKFGALPGDMNSATAAQFGFTTRAGTQGQGDGNGVIEGENAGTYCEVCQYNGETGLFWVDLSSANGKNLNLIDQSFYTAVGTGTAGGNPTPVNLYMPTAAIGQQNYVYVYSTGGQNYFGLSGVAASHGINTVTVAPALTVRQAFALDSKVDDGLPQSGRVQAIAVNGAGLEWAQGINNGASPGQSASPTTMTCYDNGGSSSNSMLYSLGTYNSAYNNSNKVNCWLSFQFQ